MESKVDALRGGSVLVTPEERLEVQGTYEHRLGLWRKRKKIYQELWGMITESMTENLKDLKVPNYCLFFIIFWSIKSRLVHLLFNCTS